MLQSTAEFIAPLLEELSAARDRTDFVFAQVPPQLFFERPIPERHRIAFYLGHLEAFDLNLLWRAPNASQQTNSLDRLFAFGIDPLGDALPTDVVADWPPLTEIQRYANDARGRLDLWLQSSPPSIIDNVPLTRLLNAAIEHRLMHAETLAYMLNHLPNDRPPHAIATNLRELRDDDMISIPAGIATLGMHAEGSSFGWDNEYQEQRVEVAAFHIDRYMVSNAQFLHFVLAEGYSDSRWWQAEDWQWLASQRIRHPAAWRRVADTDNNQPQEQWRLLSLHEELPFQNDWPVYVSQAEANAYANWIGKQLPTEAQWHRAAYGTLSKRERSYPWGEDAPDTTRGNFNFDRWDPLPVDAHPQGTSAFGVQGLLGNGWEWTSTHFAAFPGFEAFSFYRGYSADFFDNKHFVLKGGSAHTATRMLRRSFRNWFQPHYPYPFAGFRCVSK